MGVLTAGLEQALRQQLHGLSIRLEMLRQDCTLDEDGAQHDEEASSGSEDEQELVEPDDVHGHRLQPAHYAEDLSQFVCTLRRVCLDKDYVARHRMWSLWKVLAWPRIVVARRSVAFIQRLVIMRSQNGRRVRALATMAVRRQRRLFTMLRALRYRKCNADLVRQAANRHLQRQCFVAFQREIKLRSNLLKQVRALVHRHLGAWRQLTRALRRVQARLKGEVFTAWRRMHRGKRLMLKCVGERVLLQGMMTALRALRSRSVQRSDSIRRHMEKWHSRRQLRAWRWRIASRISSSRLTQRISSLFWYRTCIRKALNQLGLHAQSIRQCYVTANHAVKFQRLRGLLLWRSFASAQAEHHGALLASMTACMDRHVKRRFFRGLHSSYTSLQRSREAVESMSARRVCKAFQRLRWRAEWGSRVRSRIQRGLDSRTGSRKLRCVGLLRAHSRACCTARNGLHERLRRMARLRSRNALLGWKMRSRTSRAWQLLMLQAQNCTKMRTRKGALTWLRAVKASAYRRGSAQHALHFSRLHVLRRVMARWATAAWRRHDMLSHAKVVQATHQAALRRHAWHCWRGHYQSSFALRGMHRRAISFRELAVIQTAFARLATNRLSSQARARKVGHVGLLTNRLRLASAWRIWACSRGLEEMARGFARSLQRRTFRRIVRSWRYHVMQVSQARTARCKDLLRLKLRRVWFRWAVEVARATRARMVRQLAKRSLLRRALVDAWRQACLDQQRAWTDMRHGHAFFERRACVRTLGLLRRVAAERVRAARREAKATRKRLVSVWRRWEMRCREFAMEREAARHWKMRALQAFVAGVHRQAMDSQRLFLAGRWRMSELLRRWGRRFAGLHQAAAHRHFQRTRTVRCLARWTAYAARNPSHQRHVALIAVQFQRSSTLQLHLALWHMWRAERLILKKVRLLLCWRAFKRGVLHHKARRERRAARALTCRAFASWKAYVGVRGTARRWLKTKVS